MTTTPDNPFQQAVMTLLAEAYQGPPTAERSWFLDNDVTAGLFGTLANLSAEQASRPLVPGGTTVAAHAEHLRWALAHSNAIARGETPTAPWSESWTVTTVDEPAWRRLQQDLTSEFQTLVSHVPQGPMWQDYGFLCGAVALVGHAAYHLGAMKQLALSARS